jgi:hypothetical protein
MVCALEMASSSSLQSRPAESTSLWPFFTSKKYRDIFRTAFCLVLRARPQLFVAAQGWDRAGHATRRSLWPNHQSFDPQIVPTHRASGSNGNAMGCDLNDRKVHSAGGQLCPVGRRHQGDVDFRSVMSRNISKHVPNCCEGLGCDPTTGWNCCLCSSLRPSCSLASATPSPCPSHAADRSGSKIILVNAHRVKPRVTAPPQGLANVACSARRNEDAQLGAETAPGPALYHPRLDLVCGSRPVHCGVDLRGPSNGRLIWYGLFRCLGRPLVRPDFAGCQVKVPRLKTGRQARSEAARDALRVELRRSSSPNVGMRGAVLKLSGFKDPATEMPTPPERSYSARAALCC